MVEAVIWWVTLEILGLLAVPLAGVFLRGLPDRGYSAAKILGLLLVGWLAYTIAMSKLVQFGPILLIVCAAIVLVLDGFLLFRNGRALWNDMREFYSRPATLRFIATAEVLFTIAFALCAWTRAFNPVIAEQEKFMDFGFLNAILKSPTFPPNDMWLAGNSINYYYFGYILLASLTALSGIRTEIAFNLADATLLALSALGVFGIVWNLISATITRRYARVRTTRNPVTDPLPSKVSPSRADREAAAEIAQSGGTLTVRRSRVAPAGATATIETPEASEAPVTEAPEAPIEEQETPAIHVEPDDHSDEPETAAVKIRPSGPAYELAENIQGATRSTPFYLSAYPYAIIAALMLVVMGNLTVMFAKKDLSTGADMQGDGLRFCFNCNTGATFDWWAPSRVIQDYTTTTVDGQTTKTKVGFENISEFPAFSFVLGDIHAHVLALPLVLLVVAGALALARRKVLRATEWRDGVPPGLTTWLALIAGAIAVGALYTTNTWDYPTYLILTLAALALPYIAAQRRGENPQGWDWLKPWLVQSGLLAALSLITFLPFHLTFKSLVGGANVQVADNIANIPILGWVEAKLAALVLINTADKTILGFIVIFGIFLLALLVWLGYEFATFMGRKIQAGAEPAALLLPWGIGLVVILIAGFVFKFPLLAFLLPLAIVALFLIWQEPQRMERNFVLGGFALAALIGIAIEVVFLRDNFQMRMNTIFKFYYQIWLLWSIAAAYGLWRTLHAAFSVRRTQSGAVISAPAGAKVLAGVWTLAILFLVLSGCLYTVYGVQSRQIGGQTQPQGLDGMAWIKQQQPNDYAAINWLKENGTGKDVVLEAGRDEYSHTGRVASYSGVPTLIAWDTSHESLWRTNQPELEQQISIRRQLVDAIYQGVDPTTQQPMDAQRMLNLLHQYNVTYVFAGASERGVPGWAPAQESEWMTSYGEGLFTQALPVAFRSGDTVIYSVQQTISGTGVIPPTPAPATPTGQAATDQPDANVPPAALFDHDAASANFGRFNLPRGIARDAAGDFYVVDTQNLRIEKFDKDGKYLLAFGSKGSGDGQFGVLSDTATGTGPSGVALDSSGNVYVTDTWNHRIEKFDSNGKFLLAWGSFLNLGDAQYANDPDKNTRFYGPRGIAIGPNNEVYVTDTGNKRVLIFDATGAYKSQIDSGVSPTKTAPDYPFNLPGELNEPIGIAVDSAGNVYVADTNNSRIQKFDSSGKAVAQWSIPAGDWAPGPYLEPFLALDRAGNLYAAAPSAKTVLKFSPTGEVSATKQSDGTNTLQLPTGIWADADGTVYVVDTVASAILKLGAIP